MNYRVYVKQAKDNIIGELVRGTIDQQGISHIDSSQTTWYITKEFLPVDISHTYELVKLFDSGINYYVYQYDSNKDYRGSVYRQDRNGTSGIISLPKIYTPNSSEVKYIKLEIRDTDNYPDSGYFPMMFLRSSDPVLIHDSNSPEKEYHLINPTLQLSDSTAGSLEFVIYPGHSYYQNKINLFTDTFYVTRVYKDGSEKIKWDGRAITEEIDAEGNKAYHCEGALSYLNDIHVVSSQYRPIKRTIYEFLNDYIVAQQSDNSFRNNRMDRSFYSYKDTETGEYVDTSSIFCDQGTKYEFTLNYENGLQWINDIKETFGGHIKVRYRPYDSVKDDIICRSFTYIQDFDRFFIIPDFKSLLNAHGTKIGRGSLFSYRPNKKVTRSIYIAATDFYIASGYTFKNYTDNGYLVLLDPDLVGVVNDENQVDNTKSYWVIKNADIAIQKPEALRFSVLHAKFGTDIFEAKKTSEISGFATNIIPRGMSVENAGGAQSYIYLTTTSAIIDGEQKQYERAKDKQGSVINSDFMRDRSLTKQYGYIEGVVDFESASTPQELYDLAYDWFKDIRKRIIRSNIEISLVDLGQAVQNDSSDPFSDSEYIDIWTQIYAEIPAFGITEDSPEQYYVSEMNIPLDDYLNTQVTLANKAVFENGANFISNDIVAVDNTQESNGIIAKVPKNIIKLVQK